MSAPRTAVIIPYRTSHVEDVWLIDRLCFVDPWLKRSFLAECEPLGALNRVAAYADDFSRILGFCFGRIIEDEYTMHRLAVHPDWQRRGIALYILNACMHHAALHGARHCYIEVRSGNTAAQRLYEGCGFEHIGIRKNYYRVGFEDAILMRRTLDRVQPRQPA